MPLNRMQVSFALKMAVRSMTVHRVRTILTILAVTWSVATLISLRTVGVGVKAKVSQEINEFLQSDILVTEDNPTIPEQVPDMMLSIPNVKEAVGAVFVPARVGGVRSVNLLGVRVQDLRFFNINLVNGTLPSGDAADEIIIDVETARSLGLTGPGATVKVTVKYGTLYFEKDYRVVGIIKQVSGLSKLFGASFALAPRRSVQGMIGRQGFINYIFIRVTDRGLVNDVDRAIKNAFPGVSTIKETDIVSVVLRIMDIINGTLTAVTLIGLLVAALGVMNTVMMSIRERIREIGILKTIGARDEFILTVFMLEVSIIGVSGGLLGMVLGYLESFLLRDFIMGLGLPFDIPVYPVPEAFAMGFLISLAVSLLAAFYPIYRVVKLRPIEALKIE